MKTKTESLGESLDKVIRELERGQHVPCYLIYGEDEFLLKDALNRLLNLLIPPADRDLNLVAVDGEEADVAALCEQLITSPLFPGSKVVTVHRAPFFHSRQTTGDMIRRVRERIDTDPVRACRDFMAFLAIAGWNLDDLKEEGWKKITDEDWLRIIDGEPGRQREAWLPKVVSLCIQHGLSGRKQIDETEQLDKTLVAGLPAGHHLILTATVVDKRKRLFKTISEVGRVVHLPQTQGEIRQKAQLMASSREMLSAVGKVLTDGAWTLLGQKTGFDLRNSISALEKLIIHAGDRSVINEKDVADLIGKTREDNVFALTSALAEKNSGAGLAALDELLDRGEQPLMLLAMLARELRFLMQAKIILMVEGLDGFSARVEYSAFQARFYPRIKELNAAQTDREHVIELAGQHPYVVYRACKNTERFSYAALVGCLEQLAAADLHMKTTGRNPRLLLEQFILRACSSP